MKCEKLKKTKTQKHLKTEVIGTEKMLAIAVDKNIIMKVQKNYFTVF